MQRGQGMVEFALVIPMFLLLMLAIFEFGYFFFVYSSANSATREAARYGAGSGTGNNSAAYYLDCKGIREVAVRLGRYANIQGPNMTINYDNGPGTSINGVCTGDIGTHEPEMGERIVVRLNVDYHPIILKWILPDVNIHVESARTIITRLQIGG